MTFSSLLPRADHNGDGPSQSGNDRSSRPVDIIVRGLGYYYLTSLVVLLGAVFGAEFARPRGVSPARDETTGLVDSMVRFDGSHYVSIVRSGYQYDPTRRSTVAFFPAYPLLARLVSAATGLEAPATLVLVSNALLAAAFVLLAWYLACRVPAVPHGHADWVLLAFGLWPSTFVFRMAYAESMFLCATLLTLVGISRRWPLALLGWCAGLATAVRPVGVAVSAAFLWYVLRRPGERLSGRVVRAVAVAPLAVWGLLAYMAYQYWAFGNALAFAQTQEHWALGVPAGRSGLGDKLWALMTLEPIIGVYDPRSGRYWSGVVDNPLLTILFWNPVLFVLTAALVAYGAYRRWLSGPETVLGAALLGIPYLTRSYEMSMASHARFAAVVVVIYPLLGRGLGALPAAAAAAMAALSAAVLLCWSALYTSGYPFF